MKKLVIAGTMALGVLAAIPLTDGLGQGAPGGRYAAARNYARWEKEVAAY